jgi:hypothetical protein
MGLDFFGDQVINILSFVGKLKESRDPLSSMHSISMLKKLFSMVACIINNLFTVIFK